MLSDEEEEMKGGDESELLNIREDTYKECKRILNLRLELIQIEEAQEGAEVFRESFKSGDECKCCAIQEDTTSTCLHKDPIAQDEISSISSMSKASTHK